MIFDFNDFSKAFLSILFTGMPFLLFGTVLAGFVEAFVPANAIQKVLPKNKVLAVFFAGGLGMIFPMCECGVVAVLRRLLGKGLPISFAVTYMFASPIVNPIVMVSTYTAFTGQNPLSMTVARLLLGFSVAVIVGLTIIKMPAERVLSHRLLKMPRLGLFSGGFPKSGFSLESLSTRAKIRHALHCAAVDFLDVSVFLVMGAAVAGVFNTALPQASLAVFSADPLMAIQVMIGLSVILCLCSTSDAFVAAILQAFPPAAKLAMLVFGPMFDLKLLFLYLSAFHPWFILRTVLIIYILTTVSTYILHYLRWLV